MLLIGSSLTAQYTGGEGDGYAMAEAIIESDLLEPSIVVYPNVLHPQQNLQVQINGLTDFQFHLIGINGQILLGGDSSTPNLFKNLSYLPSGQYLLHFFSDNFEQVEKIIVLAP